MAAQLSCWKLFWNVSSHYHNLVKVESIKILFVKTRPKSKHKNSRTISELIYALHLAISIYGRHDSSFDLDAVQWVTRWSYLCIRMATWLVPSKRNIRTILTFIWISLNTASLLLYFRAHPVSTLDKISGCSTIDKLNCAIC